MVPSPPPGVCRVRERRTDRHRAPSPRPHLPCRRVAHRPRTGLPGPRPRNARSPRPRRAPRTSASVPLFAPRERGVPQYPVGRIPPAPVEHTRVDGVCLHRPEQRIFIRLMAADSSVAPRRVPIHTPDAPRAMATAMPRASAIPPAATTGTGPTASATSGTSAMADTCPQTCPRTQRPGRLSHRRHHRPPASLGRAAHRVHHLAPAWWIRSM